MCFAPSKLDYKGHIRKIGHQRPVTISKSRHEVTANENSNDFVSWRRKLLREHIEYSCHCISVGGGMGDMLPDMMQRSTILFIKLQRDFSFSVRVSLARNVLLFWPKKVSQRENKSP